MPRVYITRARRDYPEVGVKKGENYYHWSFYRGRKQMSSTPPKRSQLTQREELINLYDAEDMVGELEWEEANREDLASKVDDIITTLQSAHDAAQEKYDNLPENFQQAEQGQFLESFTGECEDTISTLESIKGDLEDEDIDFEEIGCTTDVSFPNDG